MAHPDRAKETEEIPEPDYIPITIPDPAPEGPEKLPDWMPEEDPIKVPA